MYAKKRNNDRLCDFETKGIVYYLLIFNEKTRQGIIKFPRTLTSEPGDFQFGILL